MRRRVLSIIIIIALILTSYSRSLATTSEQYKAQADQAESNSQKAKDDLENVEAELDSALQEVSKITDSISEVQEDIDNLSSKIKELDNSISEKEADLKEKETLLDERLSASYMNGGANPYLEAFFTGGLFNFISNFDMIKQIAEYDNTLINQVKETKTALENEKKQAQEAKSEKEAKSAELKKLKNQKQQKVDSLTDEQKDLQAKIDEYDNQMKLLRQKEKEQAAKEEAAAKAAAAKAAAERAAAQAAANRQTATNTTPSTGSSSNVSSSGKFLWPVPSSTRISSGYGYRIHPIYKTQKFHAGIDIAAGGGSNIVAAEAGTVILSSFGYNGGYGNYIIISHGNGVTTRYAHCSNLFVKVGDTVSRGQVIAAVGSTGASTGNHLHFEVRIDGNSKDPTNYV